MLEPRITVEAIVSIGDVMARDMTSWRVIVSNGAQSDIMCCHVIYHN